MLFKMVLTTYKIVILDAQIDYEHSEKIKCHKTNSFREETKGYFYLPIKLFSVLEAISIETSS